MTHEETTLQTKRALAASLKRHMEKEKLLNIPEEYKLWRINYKMSGRIAL